MAEKKAAYAEYRKAREAMKELLTAKANIDRFPAWRITVRSHLNRKRGRSAVS